MFGRSRSSLRIPALCGFLLLAFSVFAWGMNAKLSLYQPGHAAPSSATVAKLLAGEQIEAAFVTAARATQPQTAWQLTLSFAAALLLLPLLQRRRLARSPAPRRPQALLPPHRSSRPPPFGPRSR